MVKSSWVPSLVLVVLLASCGYLLGSNIPDYIHICHRSDPKVAECIKKSVEALRPHLVKGIPELDVPGLDPFKLDRIVIFDGITTPNLEAYLDDVVGTGASNFQVTKLKLDVDKKIYRIGVKIPYLEMNGLYKVDAKLLATPIKSEGKFHANATNIDGQVLAQGILEDNHLKFASIAFKIKIGDFNLDVDNLLINDPVISRAARELLTSNKMDLLGMAIPHIERKCSEIIMQLSNQITMNFDYDEVFPV